MSPPLTLTELWRDEPDIAVLWDRDVPEEWRSIEPRFFRSTNVDPDDPLDYALTAFDLRDLVPPEKSLYARWVINLERGEVDYVVYIPALSRWVRKDEWIAMCFDAVARSEKLSL